MPILAWKTLTVDQAATMTLDEWETFVLDPVASAAIKWLYEDGGVYAMASLGDAYAMADAGAVFALSGLGDVFAESESAGAIETIGNGTGEVTL